MGVCAQPAFGPVALAILLLGSILRRDELGHQRQHHVVAGSNDHRRQHGVIMLRLAVRALARQALRAAQFLRTEILGSIQRHQRSPSQPLKGLQTVALAQLLDDLVKTGLQGFWPDRVQHQTDVVVGWDLLHAEQRMAIRCAVALLQPPLVGQKRLALHEKQGKCR